MTCSFQALKPYNNCLPTRQSSFSIVNIPSKEDPSCTPLWEDRTETLTWLFIPNYSIQKFMFSKVDTKNFMVNTVNIAPEDTYKKLTEERSSRPSNNLTSYLLQTKNDRIRASLIWRKNSNDLKFIMYHNLKYIEIIWTR